MEFITSTSEENYKASNRQGVVVAVPLGYKGPIKVSDILLVHHNVFKFYNDMKGRQKSGKSFFMDDLFFVDNEQFYMYNKNNKWYCHDRYCFVEPIPPVESFVYKPMSEEPLMGKLKYLNDKLKKNWVVWANREDVRGLFFTKLYQFRKEKYVKKFVLLI